jgi:hypothetical protein
MGHADRQISENYAGNNRPGTGVIPYTRRMHREEQMPDARSFRRCLLSLSTVIPSDLEEAQLGNTTRLRDLDAFEEFFWLMEQSVNVSHAVVVEVKGTTTIAQWQDALDAVQIRYPLLSASIRKIPGQRPFFEKKHGTSLPLRMAPLMNSLVLEEEMEKELERSFGDGSGPLTRATLFHGHDRSVVMFATHHSSLDGKSHLLLVQDLLAAVAGEDLGEPLEVQRGLGQLLGLPAPPAYGKKLAGGSVAPEEAQRVEMRRVRVRRVQLSVGETEALLRRAREEGTTVHAALVAALTLAGKRYSEAWRVGPVRGFSSIDMRGALGIPDAAGLLIGGHLAPVATPDGASFWDIARAVREGVLPAQSVDGALHFFGGVSAMVAEEQNAHDLYLSVLNGPMAHELLVTNYAAYRARTEYGGLEVENLFTGSPAVRGSVQKVSVLTVNGRLGMTLVSREVFPTLLEDAREILTRV